MMAETTRKLMACHGAHLGDVWAGVNTAILNNYNLSKFANHEGKNIEKKINEVKVLLEGGDDVMVIRKIVVEKNKFTDKTLWETPYIGTKIKWTKKNYDRICYQFDGISARYIKNLTEEEEELFFTQHYDAIRLGGHLSLEDCVKIAATSNLFVGVCSGMSHLCHSVGIPVYLVGHERLHKYHVGKKYIYCNNMKEFIAKYSNKSYDCKLGQKSKLAI